MIERHEVVVARVQFLKGMPEHLRMHQSAISDWSFDNKELLMKTILILPAIVLGAASLGLSTSAVAAKYTDTRPVGPVPGFFNATGHVISDIGKGAARVVGGVAQGTGYVVRGVAHTTTGVVKGVAHTTTRVVHKTTHAIHHKPTHVVHKTSMKKEVKPVKTVKSEKIVKSDTPVKQQ